MVAYREFQEFAAEELDVVSPSEISVRRAISAIYYGLFHRLATDGASMFQAGGQALVAQASRAYAHADMLEVCKAYLQPPDKPLPPPLRHLHTARLDPRLIDVAAAFTQLQAERHAADYDLTRTMRSDQGLELLRLAELAHSYLDEMAGHPDTTIFLTALLLHKRWKGRG